MNSIYLALLLSALTYALLYFFMGIIQKKSSSSLAITDSPNKNISPAFNLIPRGSAQPENEELSFELEEEDDLEQSGWELVDDDDISILLKEAEHVTESVDHVIQTISSDPVNSAEVFTKIRAILSQYRIFLNTEFYDAINRYVAVAVERDLSISFTPDEITELWS